MFLEVYPQVLGVSTIKRCSTCGEYKPADSEHFHRNKRSSDGLYSRCKQCEIDRQRKYYAINQPERECPSTKVCPRCGNELPLNADYWYRAKHSTTGFSPNCKHCIDERNRTYARRNPDVIEKSKAGWIKRDPERRRRSARNWRKNNPEKASVLSAIRRAAGTVTADEVKAIRAGQTDSKGQLICWRCGKPIIDTPHLDHWVPVKEGGVSNPGNLHFMHAKCNLSKGAKHPHDMGRLI